MTLHIAVGGPDHNANLIDAYNFPRKKSTRVFTKIWHSDAKLYSGNDGVPLLYVVSDAAGMFELLFLLHLG